MSVVRLKRPRIGPRSAGVAMTPEEFDGLPEERWVEGYRYELINGVLVVSPPPADAEADPNDELGYLLRLHRDSQPDGPAFETIPERTVPATSQRRRADRVIWTGLGRNPDTATDVPSIVIEFVSRSKRDFQRDYQEKLREYMNAGVREYWIIDRFRRVMVAHRRTFEGHEEVVIREGQSYRTDLLPGFELALSRLLTRGDQWPPQTRRPRKRKPPRGGNE